VTLQEIRNLKFRIDYNIDALHERELQAAVISTAFEILLEREASDSLIQTWIKSINGELEAILEALEEIEKELLD